MNNGRLTTGRLATEEARAWGTVSFIFSAELDGKPITVNGSPFEISTDLGADRELVVKYDA